MSRAGRAGRQLKSYLWRASTSDEVTADVEFHLDMLTRELMERGMTEKQARSEAERRFGDVGSVIAESKHFADERDRNERRAEHRNELMLDATFAMRQLARARAFSITAILTLALGFGATATVFSALYAVVLKPLPFDDPERVVRVEVTRRGEAGNASRGQFLALRDEARGAFVHVAAIQESGFTIHAGEHPDLIQGGRVSADYFRVFGVAPEMGRTFTREEDVPGNDAVVVLGHRTWMNEYGGDRNILGRSVQVDGAPRTVIGVMPASFEVTTNSDRIWVPLAVTREGAREHSAGFLQVFALLNDRVTPAQAAAAATTAVRQEVALDPNRRVPVEEYSAELTPFVDQLVGDYKALLLILLGAVGFVLLIASTNVANLLIARGTTRAREFAIRAALGAGRGRLVRQMLTESLVLAIAGAVVGLVLAFVLLRVVLALSPEEIPRLDQAAINGQVLAFTFALAGVSTIAFGLFPAFRVAGGGLERALREGGRAVRGGRDRVRMLLVSAEVALAMTLLVGAALLLRSAWLVQRVEPGFEPRGVLTARLMLPEAKYGDAPAIIAFYSRLHEQANQTPGIRSAALVTTVPLSGNQMNASIISEDQSLDEARPLRANLRLASPRYFETMGIDLLAGRDLEIRDGASAPHVVIINEALAARFWPNVPLSAVLGKRVNTLAARRDQPNWMTIVGVVSNLHDASLRTPPEPEFYAPFQQVPANLWPLLQRSLVLAARGPSANTPAESLDRSMRAAVAAVDRTLPFTDVSAMTTYLRNSQATSRFNTVLLTTLGAIALALAMIGVYGVVNYFVSQRTQEIALRMALGATPAGIWRFVAARGLWPLGLGLAVGAVLAVFTARVVESQLYRVSPTDPGTIGATAFVLAVVALAATYAPARRAMRVQPIAALQ